MKAHIGVDAESGLVHTVIGTAANVNDVTQAAALLHAGADGDIESSYRTLRALHAHHVAAIAFENIDPMVRRTPDLSARGLMAKLVHGGRGGHTGLLQCMSDRSIAPDRSPVRGAVVAPPARIERSEVDEPTGRPELHIPGAPFDPRLRSGEP